MRPSEMPDGKTGIIRITLSVQATKAKYLPFSEDLEKLIKSADEKGVMVLSSKAVVVEDDLTLAEFNGIGSAGIRREFRKDLKILRKRSK